MGHIHVTLDQVLTAYAKRTGESVDLAAVSQRSGIALETLQALQQGRADDVTLGTLARVCDHFGCKLRELLLYVSDQQGDAPTEVDSRDIVERWERRYGDDEYPRQ